MSIAVCASSCIPVDDDGASDDFDGDGHSVNFGLAMNQTIQRFAEMCKDYGGVTECLRFLLSRKSRRKFKYQFQPLTNEACEWHIISRGEEVDGLKEVLLELDHYVNANRLKDRASGIEELLFTITTDERSLPDCDGDDAVQLLELHYAGESYPKDCHSNYPLTTDDNNEDYIMKLNDQIESGHLLDVIVCTDETTDEQLRNECKSCHKKFKSKQKRTTHACKSLEDLPHCPVCGECFNTKFNMQQHCRQAHRRHLTFDKNGNAKIVNRELLECDECDYVALRAGRMSTHRKEVHGIVDQISCETCNKIFPTHRKRHHHVMQFHTLINVACEICGKICKNRASFQRHRLAHSRTFQCRYCPKVFHDRRSYNQHEKRHTDSTAYPCPHCGRAFNQRGNMERHVKVMHLKKGELVCELCSYKTFYAITLRDHVERVHHGVRRERYHCTVCDRGFVRRLNYDEHMDKHEGRYRYTCEKCGKNFRNKGRCKQHFLHCTSKNSNKVTHGESEVILHGHVDGFGSENTSLGDQPVEATAIPVKR